MLRSLSALVLLAVAPSALAQSSLADGPGAYLSLRDLDVRGADGRTAAALAAGWRFGPGVDVGVSLDAHDERARSSDVLARAHVGKTWFASRLLSTDLAVAPVVRLGVGLEDHAFWGDGSLRLVADF